MPHSVLPLLSAVAAAACFSTATVLQCVGARRVGEQDAINLRLLVQLAKDRIFLLGVSFDAVGLLFAVAALGSLPLFLVQAITASSAGLTALLAFLVLGERLRRSSRWALVGLVLGLTLLTPAAEPSEAAHPSVALQLLFLSGLPMIAGAARLVRGDHRSSAAQLGGLAGVALAASSIAARMLPHGEGVAEMAQQPATWGVGAFAALGMVIFSAGLQRGSAMRVTAACMAGEVLLPAVFGVLVLGDHARSGSAGRAAVGFAVTLMAALALALPSDEPLRDRPRPRIALRRQLQGRFGAPDRRWSRATGAHSITAS